MTVKFTIPGPPHGKERPRLTKTGHAYTPAKTKEYEIRGKKEYIAQCGGKLLFGSLVMKILAYYPIPKSATKTQKEQMQCSIIRPTVKPDADNICKIVADLLNGMAYDDDSQLVFVSVAKYYSDNPRVEVAVCELGTEGIDNG
jgi:Holliday junction resolvase RusA-like endonuclease